MTDVFSNADRPRAPVWPDAARTAVGRHGQQMLVAVHHHLRSEMTQVVRAVHAALEDTGAAAGARALINKLTMRVNYRQLGSFCGHYCQVVAMHHRIEDQVLFVELEAADPDLEPVLARLSVEHDVIHDALVALDTALVRLLSHGADALPMVADAVRYLEAGLLSHLNYEEEELLPALGRLQVRV